MVYRTGNVWITWSVRCGAPFGTSRNVSSVAFSVTVLTGKLTQVCVSQIQKEFETPKEFAHYRGPQRQRAFINLFYHQLLERGFWP